MPKEWNVAMSASVHSKLAEHLIREDGQEDLTFALWNPSIGAERSTALITSPLLPRDTEREVHGNVSFMPAYLERVCRLAMEQGMGLAFVHSHPFPGWQGMSQDDVAAEQKMAGAVLALTGHPLVGMTIGSDETWSARVWPSGGKAGKHHEQLQWCSAVRVVGERLQVDFAEALRPSPVFRDMFRRTFAMWGSINHARMARLHIGIIGLGSVGSLVAETLTRMGCQDFVFIDFDKVEPHNLDRLVTATASDIGRPKVAAARERVESVGTADDVSVRTLEYSLAEDAGYSAALDCDVLFSCVDRPRARHILNHFAYAHLIPVIDGGIVARFRDSEFRGADWQVQTAAPGRPCLECLGTYDPADVSTETAGKLDDPSYLAGLPADHRFKRNENVFPFSMNLASLEVLQFVALVTGAAGIHDFGIQRYRYVPGIVEQLPTKMCKSYCDVCAQIGVGDKYFRLSGRDLAAERSRGTEVLVR
jgi:molybdopterin/thiamine biosynthesis adenylyltransferase